MEEARILKVGDVVYGVLNACVPIKIENTMDGCRVILEFPDLEAVQIKQPIYKQGCKINAGDDVLNLEIRLFRVSQVQLEGYLIGSGEERTSLAGFDPDDLMKLISL